MSSNRLQAVQHLFRIGALAPEAVLDGDLTVEAIVSRNHLLRVEAPDAGYIIKQPQAGAQDGVTMWTEATLFWLSAHDPAWAPLARWLPRFVHYDETQRVLTIEHVAHAAPLTIHLLGAGVPPRLAAETGLALGTLHGPVSRGTGAAPGRALFGSLIPWALTLGSAETRYAPVSTGSATVLAWLAARPDVLAALARLRGGWRYDAVIHGDIKAPNVLVVDDASVRLIDWELAARGDARWDVAGLVHSLLVPNPAGPVEGLETAQERARPLFEAFWRGWREALGSAPGSGDDETVLAMAGARLLQTCLESTHYGGLPPGVPGLFAIGAALLVDPATARARWRW